MLCPRLPLYLDFVQHPLHQYGRKWSKGEYAPMERVYHFPGTGYTSGISVATPLVKGLQGNVWTERIHTSERLQFMVYPPAVGIGGSRMDARSVKKNYENFNLRMDRMMEIYKIRHRFLRL